MAVFITLVKLWSPFSNVNVTIDELTSQIVSRYKVINSSEPSFREPDKVTLKSSDDLILFGKDLIKDVLNDQCQVRPPGLDFRRFF